MHMELTLRFDCHYFDIDLELRYHLKIGALVLRIKAAAAL